MYGFKIQLVDFFIRFGVIIKPEYTTFTNINKTHDTFKNVWQYFS